VAVFLAFLWSGFSAPLSAHAQPATAQDVPLSWQPLKGPGGSLSHLASEPGTANLYAVADINARRQEDQTQWSSAGTPIRSAALYRSQDGGVTWQPASNNLIPGPITALFADQKTGIVYVGVQPSGLGSTEPDSIQEGSLWASADHGAHWRSVPLGVEGLRIQRIARSAAGDLLVLGAATAGALIEEETAGYVLRSSDGGATWQSNPIAADGEHPSVVADLVPDPTRSNRLFVTTDAGEIFASDDQGRSWQVALAAGTAPASPAATHPKAVPTPSGGPAEAPARTVYLAVAADRPDVLVSARAESTSASTGVETRLTVRRSSDGGRTWSALPASGLAAAALPNSMAALPGGTFLLNTSFGTYRSTDAGATWQALEGPLSGGDVSTFVTAPGSPGLVLGATAYGLFASKDAGALWQPLGKGLPFNSSIAGLLTDARQPNRVFAITYAAHPGQDSMSAVASPSTPELRPPMLLRSADGGMTWTPASSELPGVSPMAWALDPNDPSTLFISSRELLFRTTDAGLNWLTADLPAGGHFALAVAPADSNVIYLAGSPPLRSADRGATWHELSPIIASAGTEVTGLVVDPADSSHVWASVSPGGVFESQDGGISWQPAGPGLDGKPVRWLAGAAGPFPLYAGVTAEGIYRWDPQDRSWKPASSGLPEQSTILAFVADPDQPEILWAGRDGGGIYRSADGGATWVNVSGTATQQGTALQMTGAAIGDNLAQALAINYTPGGSLFLGTATAGLWALKPSVQPAPAPRRVDARIEVVWPHDSAPVSEARQANIGLRLFTPGSLLQPPCGWSPQVIVWQAQDNSPAKPLQRAEQRTIDGTPFPFWELNDLDVSYAMDPQYKLYFMVQVEDVDTSTSIWTHGSDPRTYYPFPDVPSGVASGNIDAVDARIQVVWPHDGAGNLRDTSEADYVNVAVAFYKHGTRLSVPVGWTPAGMVLHGAWNQEISQPLANEAVMEVRKAGAITYPTWEFNNIPVDRAKEAANKIHLWVTVDGAETYPTIWTHGADARTLFPTKDEPVQGCVP
jgi:photosystem II stability/assembly factor-like uncharacterized protein